MTIYSNSRLSTFENCPLQYKFSYIDEIKRARKCIEAFMDSCFHDVMGKLYKDLKFRTYSLEELLNYYEAQWDREYSDAIVITEKDRTAEDYKNIGRKCVENYYKRYYPFSRSRVLGLEKRILIDLNDDGKYQMQGYIDRIDQNEDDTYEIHDYKTSGHLPDQKQLDEDRQLALYHIGIQNVWNDVKKVNLIWHYVAFDKEMTSTRTEEQLDKLREDTIEIISRIENAKEFLPKESNLCEQCMYPDLCPKRKHLYKVEALPVNEYLKDSGVKLVNTFTKLGVKKKKHQEDVSKIEEEMDKLKEAIIKYIEKEDIVAHEIRNPLTNIRIAAQQLHEFSVGTPLAKYINMIIKNAEEANNLIIELLNCAKAPKLNLKPYNIHDILDNVLNSCDIQLQKIEVVKEFTAKLPIINMDKKQIERAFSNLVINAIEAMSKSRRKLTIVTGNKGNFCTVKIQDTGKGISEEELDRAFSNLAWTNKGNLCTVKTQDTGKGIPGEDIIRTSDPFFITEPSGIGLGLTTCFGIIDSHGGLIGTLSNTSNSIKSGSSFTISLPIN